MFPAIPDIFRSSLSSLIYTMNSSGDRITPDVHRLLHEIYWTELIPILHALIDVDTSSTILSLNISEHP